MHTCSCLSQCRVLSGSGQPSRCRTSIRYLLPSSSWGLSCVWLLSSQFWQCRTISSRHLSLCTSLWCLLALPRASLQRKQVIVTRRWRRHCGPSKTGLHCTPSSAVPTDICTHRLMVKMLAEHYEHLDRLKYVTVKGTQPNAACSPFCWLLPASGSAGPHRPPARGHRGRLRLTRWMLVSLP